MDKTTNLVWMDLEMTGLEPEQDRILEMATLITDSELNIIAEGPNLVIHQPDAVLEGMDEWCTTHHGQSGLTAKVKTSPISESEAEQQTLDFVSQWVDQGVSPLCGNSIWQDKRFLMRHMPRLDAYFHYRVIDVSTLKELAKRWQPSALAKTEKISQHRALDDIKDSVTELQHYRQHFFNFKA